MFRLAAIYPRAFQRARRLIRFLTQPFFVTEHFTGKPGKLVSIEETLDGCEAILAGKFDDVPESALYMIGAIDEARSANITTEDEKENESPEEDSSPNTEN